MDFSDLKKDAVLVPTSSFDNTGGWCLDTQFVTTMGAPYLLAHGIGKKVEDAHTRVEFPETGRYYVKVYTFNWVAPWKPEYAPGTFNVQVGDETLGVVFGKTTQQWGWEDGSYVDIEDCSTTIKLKDLTGFEGRCGFVFFSKENYTPPTDLAKLKEFYKTMLDCKEIKEVIEADMVVCGGGIAGICASLSAARQGLKTVLIQDRPVVGGNNSSEVRVWLGGGTNYDPFPGVGNIVGELEQERIGHYGGVNTGDLYEDDKKMDLLQKQENLTTYMNCIVTDAKVVDDNIEEIEVWDIKKDEYFTVKGKWFADCTGDSTVGHLVGADYEVTTNGHMGMTNTWYIKKSDQVEKFPRCPWAVDLTDAEFPGRQDVRDVYNNQRKNSLGCWFWESGCELDPIETAEFARDMNFRAMYGAWDCVKNVDNDYTDYNLAYSSYIGGKRESRRLLGDYILTKPDVFNETKFEDGCVPSTWNFDVHYPDKRFYRAFHEGDAFLTKDYREVYKGPYFLPYRCFYSRNINNMFMAGRNVSVSHDALGAARIMRTCGMMGEIIGVAASICKKYRTNPRDVYEEHLEEFINVLKSFPNKEVYKVPSTID